MHVSRFGESKFTIDGGATVPFIARYRKEVTGGLDDVQLRELEARLSYLRELEDRRAAVLKSIDEQGKLTDLLRAAIAAAPTKQELEDIYLPFKQKRRTKGQIAKEFGIEPLADRLFADPTLDPAVEAQAFTKPPEVLDDGKPGALHHLRVIHRNGGSPDEGRGVVLDQRGEAAARQVRQQCRGGFADGALLESPEQGAGGDLGGHAGA